MMTRHDATVIVVGAGPAGSMCALLLARAGVDVLLLDRAAFPRDKPCGDCLSAETTTLLERNGLLSAVTALPHASLRGWRIVAPSGHSFEASFDGAGAIAVERRVFDHTLLRAARAAGATVRENAKVTGLLSDDADIVRGVVVDDASLRAAHVIGADGLRSVVARRLRATARQPHVRKLSLTAHVDGSLAFDAFGEMHMGDGVCVGVAPVTAARNRWNVTVVADAERFGRVVAADAAGFFARILNDNAGLRDRIPLEILAPALAELRASGPFDIPMRRIAFAGATLVGDAAGYFDPFTGQGVYHAMRSAELLAQALIEALQRSRGGGDVLTTYAHAARRLSRGPRRLQKLIDHVLSRPALADAAIARLGRAPDAARALLRVTGDSAPVRSLFSASVARSIAFPS